MNYIFSNGSRRFDELLNLHASLFGSTASNWFEGPIENDRWKMLKCCYFMILCLSYFNNIHNNDANWPNCLDQLYFHPYFWNTSILFFTRWLCLESDARIKSLLLKRSRYSFAFFPALFSSSHGKCLKEGWKRVQWTSLKLRDAFVFKEFLISHSCSVQMNIFINIVSEQLKKDRWYMMVKITIYICYCCLYVYFFNARERNGFKSYKSKYGSCISFYLSKLLPRAFFSPSF